MEKESFKKSIAKPIAETEIKNEDGEKILYVKYIGKATSDKENSIYWLGSSLSHDKNNLWFETFETAVDYAKKHVKKGITLMDISKF